MTEQNPKIDGRTKRAADIALAKRLISPASFRALVEEGTITLQQAKELGRDRGPNDTGQSGREDATETPGEGRTPRPCVSCSGMTKGGRFHPGCDQVLYGHIKRQLRSDPLLRSDKFTNEQRRYAVERGLAGPEILPEEERDV